MPTIVVTLALTELVTIESAPSVDMAPHWHCKLCATNGIERNRTDAEKAAGQHLTTVYKAAVDEVTDPTNT